MVMRHLSCLLALLMVFLGTARVPAQERELLYRTEWSEKLQEIVGVLRNPRAEKVPYDRLTRTSAYFVRIAPRQHILTKENQIKDGAILGTKPLVFLTTPESVTGRSLLDIYEDIGYEASDIIRWQRNEDMVAIVFRYPERVTISAVTDGQLPRDWDRQVFIPTWANVFVLFDRLAEAATVEPSRQGEFAPQQLFFTTPGQKNFVLAYPEEGRQRIRTSSYAVLQATGGADWVYRRSLENKLSIFAHFRGNGRTHNVVLDPTGLHSEAGQLEFVGPNAQVADLPEVAVIHLGSLTIENTYEKESIPPVSGK